MPRDLVPELPQFLSAYPRMRLQPICGDVITLSGLFDFTATYTGLGTLMDSYHLRIDVLNGFPEVTPRVTEIGSRIPCAGEYHVNPDRTLCLGSPLRLRQKLSKRPTLCGFIESCLIPYLYAVSHKLAHGGAMVFNELRHGSPGKLDDYTELFGLKNHEQAVGALMLLGMKKRLANKWPCPCGCGKKLGACHLHKKLATFRRLASRSWFRREITPDMIKKRPVPVQPPVANQVPLL